MFGGDEDFTFVDEDFLQEVFQPAETNDLVHKRSDEYGKQSCSGGVHVKPPQFNASVITPNEKGSSSDKDNENKKENSSLKFISSISGGLEKFASDDSFPIDDDFPIDNFEIERDNERSCIVSTPTDFEFTQCSNLRLCDQTQINKVLKADSATSCHTVKKDDFRSRILQTIKSSKCVSSVTHNILPSSSPLNSVSNASVECVSRTDKKLSSSDATEVRKKDRGPPVKKFCTQSCGPSESYSINFSHSIETTNILADNFKVHHQTEFSNQHKTNKVPGERNPVSRQQLVTAATSLKPVVANNWKTLSPVGPVIRKRKFPGPAGILPQLDSNLMVPDNQQLHEKSPDTVTQDVVCSQSSAYDFSRGPWQQMINDLELSHTDPVSPLQVFNIKWVLRRASLRGQAGVRKVPFLAALVHSLDVTHNDATAVLKDPTGEMNSTIASSVMDDYGPTLQSGSVLLLQGVTVLSPVGLRATATLREHTRNHYLNITLNTVVTIYTQDESGDVNTTSVRKLDKKELCKQAAAPKTAGGSRAIVEEEEDEVHGDFSPQNPSLFSYSNESFGNFSGQFNQSTTMARLPNYKSPRLTSNISQQCSSAQPHRFSQQYSPVTATRIRGHLGSVGPRMISPTYNRKIQNPRIPTSTNLQPQFQQSSLTVVHVNSNQPSVKHPNTLTSNMHGERLEKSLPSPKIFSSQAEEKEVSELLDGVDTDSLFGDF